MRKIAMLLALVMLACLWTPSLAEEPVTVTMMTKEFVNAPFTSDTLTIREMQNRLGINLDLQTVAVSDADYEEKFNLMLASGNYPDIFFAQPQWIAPYLDTGIVLDLTEILPEKMPNVYSEMQKYGVVKDATSDDGKLWFVPKIEDSIRFWEIEWINQDWLNQVGMEVPTTTDELYEVLKAFKENMGDDCIPMTMGPWGDKLHDMYCAFDTWYTWYMFSEETGMEYGPYDHAEQMRACLAYLNKLYSEDLLDHEYLTRDDDSINALIANNQTGLFYEWADDADRLRDGGSLGVNYSYVTPVAGPDGHRGWWKSNGLSLTFYINAKSEHLDEVFAMLDYMYSEEGRNLFTWGIEGETYEVVDGQKKYTEKVLTDPTGPITARRLYGVNPVTLPHVSEFEGWAGVIPPLVTEIADVTAPYANPIQPILAGTPDEETELANIMTDITKYVDSQLPLFVNGTLNTEDDFDAFIAQIERMGIAEAKAIKDAQFARWLAR